MMIRKPKTVRIAISRADGGLTIMSFVTKEYPSEMGKGWEREPTPKNIDAEIARAGIAAVSWRIIDEAEIPQDRSFRSAWADTGGRIGVDMTRAREIQRDKIREVRAPMLAALDIAYQRADETGDADEKARIAAEKQKLRDFTADPRIDAAKTPEKLKTIIPQI